MCKNRPGRIFVPKRKIPAPDQPLLVISERRYLQIGGLLDILQKAFLLLDAPVHPLLIRFDVRLHLLRLRTDIRPCGDGTVMFLHRIKADFRILVFVRPARRAVCGLLQPADFLSVLLILRLCERIRALLVFPPAREIPRLHLDGLPV